MLRQVLNLELTPVSDVLIDAGRTISLGTLPWMRVEIRATQWAGCWVRLVFEASLVDPLTRPVLRFMRSDDHEDCVLPAPVFGRGIWVGQIPPGTVELRLSPADWVGPFSFRLASLSPISLSRRVARGLERHPKVTLTALWAGLRGNRRVERSKMRLAMGATPLSMYRKWRAAGVRTVEWDRLDALSVSDKEGPRIHLILIDATVKDRQIWTRFLASQPWKNASLSWVRADATLSVVLDGFEAEDLVAVFRSGDQLASFALAAVAQRAAYEQAPLYYADEETPDGPRLKPDWSRILAGYAELIGRAWFARAGWLKATFPSTSTAGDLLSPLPTSNIERAVHIRRLLLTSRSGADAMPAKSPPSPASVLVRTGEKPLATIIIPTRDRMDLLSPCIASLRDKTSDGVFEVIVIDNDSVERRTKDFLDELTLDPRFTVLPAPGPFNFSALCNKAALLARAETLVFLNNDIEILSKDWLALLLHWAQQPDIGAVGAKLIYGDNTLQHGGVVLGIDGRAAHFERRLPLAASGFFGRLSVPHEMSAVTAACIAVATEKFRCVDGFDEQNLPVDLSDIDLCLRLAERGWRTLLEPRAILCHHESASRGKDASPEILYRREIAYFRSRWLHVLRNDPYFHPALSLDWFKPALG